MARIKYDIAKIEILCSDEEQRKLIPDIIKSANIGEISFASGEGLNIKGRVYTKKGDFLKYLTLVAKFSRNLKEQNISADINVLFKVD